MTSTDPIYFIYIIGSPGGPVKVGYSAVPDERAIQVRRHPSEKLVVLGRYPVGQRRALAVERYAHWLLRDKQISNEWFNATVKEAASAILAAIEEPVHPGYPIPSLDARASELRGGDRMVAKFPAGTRERVHRLSSGNHSDFLREAVDREIKRRESASA